MYIANKIVYNLLSIIDNIKNFLQSLTTIDIIFFFAVLLLMILLVTLLYFIKSNADYYEPDSHDLKDDLLKNDNIKTIGSFDNNDINNYEVYHNPENDKYIAINNNINQDYNDEEGELLDLETITKKLENKELAPLDLSAFEEEQEKDAIISYEELLNRAKEYNNSSISETFSKPEVSQSYNIPYKSEIMLDDLLVKEVDIKGLENGITNEEVKAVSYNEEEAFLDALKNLQQSLR